MPSGMLAEEVDLDFDMLELPSPSGRNRETRRAASPWILACSFRVPYLPVGIRGPDEVSGTDVGSDTQEVVSRAYLLPAALARVIPNRVANLGAAASKVVQAKKDSILHSDLGESDCVAVTTLDVGKLLCTIADKQRVLIESRDVFWINFPHHPLVVERGHEARHRVCTYLIRAPAGIRPGSLWTVVLLISIGLEQLKGLPRGSGIRAAVRGRVA
jgi:hypothetical protein